MTMRLDTEIVLDRIRRAEQWRVTDNLQVLRRAIRRYVRNSIQLNERDEKELIRWVTAAINAVREQCHEEVTR